MAGVGHVDDGENHCIFTFTPGGHNAFTAKNSQNGRSARFFGHENVQRRLDNEAGHVCMFGLVTAEINNTAALLHYGHTGSVICSLFLGEFL